MVRHAISRLLRILPLLFLAAIFIVPGVLAGTEEATQVFPENDTAGFVPVDIITIDPAIKEATPHYGFLILDDTGKQSYLKDLNAKIDSLNATDVRKEESKARFREKLTAIWSRYPVVSETKPGDAGYPTYGGSVITYRFASSVQNIRLSDDENRAINDSAAILREAFDMETVTDSPDRTSARTVSTARQSTPLPPAVAVTAIAIVLALLGSSKRK